MSGRVSLFFATVLAWQGSVSACTVQWRDAVVLQNEAGLVVLGKVISKSEAPPSFRGQDFTYQIEVLRVERGTLESQVLEIAYEEVSMHRRGDTVVCPLKNGSGIEHALEPGSRYRFFLGSASPPTLLIAVPDE